MLPVLRGFYPSRFETYHEPFLGSGAVFFDLEAQGLLEGRRVVLADTNSDVVGCYRAVARDVEGVVAHLERLARDHARGGSSFYYEVRDHRFNPVRDTLARQHGTDEVDQAIYPAELAAMLIYLNRTGYNGLFRLIREPKDPARRDEPGATQVDEPRVDRCEEPLGPGRAIE